LAINSLLKGRGEKELIGSAIAFSLMTVCVKQLNGRLPLAELVFVRAIVSLIITRLMLKNVQINPWGKHKRLLLLRGFLGTIALFCIFKALESLPLASATIIQYTYPTFVSIGAWIFLKERIQPKIIYALLLGWIGITFIVQPEWININGAGLPMRAVLIALLGAISTAFAYICVRKLSNKNEHPLVIIYYFPLISIPCSLPFIFYKSVVPVGIEWFWLLGIGVFTQFGQLGITKGLSLLPAARACSINYCQVIFATIWGILIFSEQINLYIITGAFFIFSSTLISVTNNEKYV
tara:strand:- start:1741 stop:2622 length:882 start_codon:yes stop_codon:yes gene_type:complete